MNLIENQTPAKFLQNTLTFTPLKIQFSLFQKFGCKIQTQSIEQQGTYDYFTTCLALYIQIK